MLSTWSCCWCHHWRCARVLVPALAPERCNLTLISIQTLSHWSLLSGYSLTVGSLSIKQSTCQTCFFPAWRGGCCTVPCQWPYWIPDSWHQQLFPYPLTQLCYHRRPLGWWGRICPRWSLWAKLTSPYNPSPEISGHSKVWSLLQCKQMGTRHLQAMWIHLAARVLPPACILSVGCGSRHLYK